MTTAEEINNSMAFTNSTTSQLNLINGIQENSVNEKKSSKSVLQRKVGLLSAITMVVGIIIGSGIFVSPSGVIKNTGSVGLSLIIWLVMGIVSMIGALCFAELGTSIPKSGAEYIYMLEAFRPLHLYAGSLPSFLFFWLSFIIIKPSSLAIVCLTFAQYLCKPMFAFESPTIVVKLFAILCLALVTFVNCFSIKLATSIQTTFTFAKILGLSAISIGGIVRLAQGHTEYLATGFENTTPSWQTISEACFSGLWAYDGWNSLNFITEEIINPYRNFPLSIFIGMPLVIVSYLLANIAYLTALSPDEMKTSEAIAVDFGDRVFGVMTWIMPLSVAMSTFGGANGGCYTYGRLPLVAAREGHINDLFSYLHVNKGTPMMALLFNGFVCLLMIIPGDMDNLINLFGFTTWLFYGLTFLALIVMRYTQKDIHRPLKVWIIFPIFLLLVSLFLVIGSLYNDPKIEYLGPIGFVAFCAIFYVIFIYFKVRINFLNSLTLFFQLLLQIVPSEFDSQSSFEK